MAYEAMLAAVFQQPGADPYPFGCTSLGELYAVSDEELRRLPCRRPPKARQPRPLGARWCYRRLGRTWVAPPLPRGRLVVGAHGPRGPGDCDWRRPWAAAAGALDAAEVRPHEHHCSVPLLMARGCHLPE
jgi:hypothetical protein